MNDFSNPCVKMVANLAEVDAPLSSNTNSTLKLLNLNIFFNVFDDVNDIDLLNVFQGNLTFI